MSSKHHRTWTAITYAIVSLGVCVLGHQGRAWQMIPKRPAQHASASNKTPQHYTQAPPLVEIVVPKGDHVTMLWHRMDEDKSVLRREIIVRGIEIKMCHGARLHAPNSAASIHESKNAKSRVRIIIQSPIPSPKQTTTPSKTPKEQSSAPSLVKMIVPKHKGNHLEVHWNHLGSGVMTRSRTPQGSHDFVVYGVVIKLCHGTQIRIPHAEVDIDGYFDPKGDMRITIHPLNSSANVETGPAGGLQLSE